MSRESLIETQPPEYNDGLAGQVATGALPSNTLTDALGGGTFGTDFVVNDLVAWMTDGNVMEAGVIQGVAANALTLYQNVQAVCSGGAGNYIFRVDSIGPYFYPATHAPSAYIRQGFNGRGVGSFPSAVARVFSVGAPFSALSKIDSNEGCLVKSIYVRLPYQFTTADSWLNISVETKITGAAGAPTGVTQIGENGYIQVPVENIEIPLNAYIPPSGVAGQTWEIYFNVNNGIPTKPTAIEYPQQRPLRYSSISTVDMPAVLTYTFQPVIIGARIIHGDTALTA